MRARMNKSALNTSTEKKPIDLDSECTFRHSKFFI